MSLCVKSTRQHLTADWSFDFYDTDRTGLAYRLGAGGPLIIVCDTVQYYVLLCIELADLTMGHILSDDVVSKTMAGGKGRKLR